MSHLKPQGPYALRLNTFTQTDIQYNTESGSEASPGDSFSVGKFSVFVRQGSVYNLAFLCAVRRDDRGFFFQTGLWKMWKMWINRWIKKWRNQKKRDKIKDSTGFDRLRENSYVNHFFHSAIHRPGEMECE